MLATVSQFSELVSKAQAAGMVAAGACQPVPMVVGSPSTPFGNEIDLSKPTYVVPDGVCGFAWVIVKPARYITLGCGRPIGLGAYVKAWKACLELPASTPIGRGVSGWGQTAGEALKDLRAGLQDRINQNIPGYGVGRKWSSDWYWPTWRAAQDLNNPRLLIRYLPPDLMKIPRFRERIEYARAA